MTWKLPQYYKAIILQLKQINFLKNYDLENESTLLTILFFKIFLITNSSVLLPDSDTHHSILFIYESDDFRFLMWVKLCSSCLPASDLLASCPPSTSMLLHTAEFPTFLRLNYIHGICRSRFLYPFINMHRIVIQDE